MKLIHWLMAGSLLAVSAAAWQLIGAPTQTDRHPAPMEGEPGEKDPSFRTKREAWIEQLHRHAPEVDWRAQDAQFRAQRFARVQTERAQVLAGGTDAAALRNVQTGAIAGQWHERGSSNQAGRVTGAIFDAANNRLTLLSQGGNVWRANRGTLAWTSPNDSARFPSAGSFERLGGSAERLLVASDSPAGVFYSDNGGLSYSSATGTNLPNPWYTMGLAVRDPAASDVYLTRVHYDSVAGSWRTALFASTNRGASFTSQGFVGESNRVALFSPRYGSSEMYLLSDASLKRIVPGTQALQTISSVPFSPAVAAGEQIALSGGVDNGQVFLYAFRSRGSQTDVFRSLDGGATWQARTPVPSSLFGLDSTESSTRNPNLVYAGGVELFRSVNGGGSWTLVNSWGDYYSDPANKLHADIPDIDVWLDSGNAERVLVSTDGGLYESTDDLATVHNLSLSGLNISQYYASLTTANGSVLAGSQDQGYQKAITPGPGIVSFVQTLSGDYGHLSSTDDGTHVWMVYPGFAMFDVAPGSLGQTGLETWDFNDNGFSGSLWMPPIVADPAAPLSALIAGGSLTGGGNRVVRLTWNGSSISAAQDSFDFGSMVTAIAFSSQNTATRYAINSDRQFFRNTGGGWSATASNLPDYHYFYGNVILSDPVRANTLYVAGSGYSNPAVLVSTTNGSSFTPMATGLPSTMVFALAISPDGQHLFAATELGAFYFDRSLSSWVDLTGLGAPEQVYWDVDYVELGGQAIARFATHGRGIWDFVISGDRIFWNGFDP